MSHTAIKTNLVGISHAIFCCHGTTLRFLKHRNMVRYTAFYHKLAS